MHPDTPDWAHSAFSRFDTRFDTLDERLNCLGEKVSKNEKATSESLEYTNHKVHELEARFGVMESRLKDVERMLLDREREIATLKEENHIIREQLIRIECHSRRENLLFCNIPEQPRESERDCLSKVQHVMMQIGLHNYTEISIDRCHRKGKFTNGKTRPIIVKFHDYGDRMRVWTGRFELNKYQESKKVYVNEDFPAEVEQRRKILYPILKRAKSMNGKYQSRIIIDKLIVNGNSYTVENLHLLPDDLNPRNTSKAENETMFCFFGRWSPLSNFHAAPFEKDGILFNCSEQAFQHSKALFFKDKVTAQRILGETKPEKQKQLGNEVQGFNRVLWTQTAEEKMYEACMAKFKQNPELFEYLQNTDNKEIVEANGRDNFFGVGLPIHDQRIFDKKCWNGENILGKVLSNIRDHTKKSSPTKNDTNSSTIAPV